MYCSNQGPKSTNFPKQNCTARALDHTRYDLCHKMQLNPNQRANAEGRYCTVLYGPVLHKTQCLKLNLLLASLTAQAEGDFCSPEERLALLHRVFPLPLPLPQWGRDSLALFMQCRYRARASTYQWSTPRGKVSKTTIEMLPSPPSQS